MDGALFSSLLAVETDVSRRIRVTQERVPGDLAHLDRPYEVQTAVDKITGGEFASLLAQTVNDVLYAWFAQVVELVYGEVDSFVQRAAVNPLVTCVPALDCRGIHELLSHYGRVAGQGHDAFVGLWKLESAHSSNSSSA